MNEIVLEVKNVTKQFHLHKKHRNSLKEMFAGFFQSGKPASDDFYALRNISFSVREGEALGIIGKNGAGKSTLLRILSGILQPGEGEINFYGKAVSILDIGAGFHPELTGRENVFFSASLYSFNKKEVEAKFDAIVEFSAIGEFINEPVKTYSSGMYLRLAFAIIAFLDADIYLIDEVISVGDADFQVKCKAKIEELISRGKTLIIASHNMNEIAMLSNRILLLENGTVINEGGLDVIQNYMARSLSQFQHMENDQCYQVKDISGALLKSPEVILHDSGIADFQQTPSGISNKHPFKIFVELELLQPKHVDLAIRFFDQTNVVLFINSTFQKNVQAITAKGKYRIEFIIPPNLLNRGLYAVDLLVLNDVKSVFDAQSAQSHLTSLLFKGDKFISMKMADEKEGDFDIKYPGVIKPIIETSVIYRESV
jgi:lipopolysaccharide transport system ATP-binding protein